MYSTSTEERRGEHFDFVKAGEVSYSIYYKEDRLAIAIRSLKDRCVTIVSLTQVLV